MAGYQGPDENVGQSGKVSEVKQQWLVHEDGVLAHKLQEEEFGAKYNWNRHDRQLARTDVPMAKVVQTEEEKRLQIERMEYLQQQRAQAEADAIVAKQAYEEELQRNKSDRLSEYDAELAHRYQQEEMITKDLLRKEREKKDQELALQMQENERRKYEIRLQQKALAKKKKEIQQQQLQAAQRVLGAGDPAQVPEDSQSPSQFDLNDRVADISLQEKPAGRVLRPDGKVEDLGDFSDFYIQPSTDMDPAEKRELQELQDEELARLLQDQEHKRGASIDKSRLKQIEDRDAELARVMMEQERLKVLKRKEAKLRQLQQRQMSEPGGPTQPHESLPHRGGSLTSGQERYEHQNHVNERVRTPSSGSGDGSSGGIRAIRRSNKAPVSSVSDIPPDMDARYQSNYGQRPLPATPASELSQARQGNGQQYSPSSHTYSENGRVRPESEDTDSYLRPQRSPSPLEEDNDSNPVSSTNVIAAIDPTFKAESAESAAPQLRTAPPAGPSPPQTINRLPPTVSSGGEDGYCDLEDLQNYTPVQGQKRTSLKRESKKGSKKDKNCKQQ